MSYLITFIVGGIFGIAIMCMVAINDFKGAGNDNNRTD